MQTNLLNGFTLQFCGNHFFTKHAAQHTLAS